MKPLVYEPKQEIFDRDIKDHKMKIELDQDVHRSIVFSDGFVFEHFRLTTWPGHLCISGDMGTFVFSRVEDMFRFFRGNAINPGYWTEKLESISTFRGAKFFDAEKFRERFIEFGIDDIEDEQKKAKAKEFIEDYLGEYEADEYGCVEAYREWDNDNEFGLDYTDFFEVDCESYTPQYIWCLRAIVWGIEQYDKFKKENETSERSV